MAGKRAVSCKGPGLEVCFDEPGSHDHHMDPLEFEFAAQGGEQAVEGMFAGAVSGFFRQWGYAGNGFVDDNVAFRCDQGIHTVLPGS